MLFSDGESMDPHWQTLNELLDGVADLHGDRPAVLFRDEGATFRELRRDASRLAGGLAALGLAAGERVAVWLPSCLDWIRLQFAAARLGLILVPLSTRFKGAEAEYILRNSDANALVVADRWHGIDYLERLGPVSSRRFPALRHLVVRGQCQSAGSTAFEDLASHAPPADYPAVRPDDPALILYTSGTTGCPKGAVLTHWNVVFNAFHMAQRQHVTPADRLLVAPPLFHVFGCVDGVVGYFSHGASVVVQEIFRPNESLELIGRHRCTAVYSTATMFQMLLEQPALGSCDRRFLRTGMIGSMPVPETVMRGVVEQLGVPEIVNGYGQTEAPVSLLTEAGAGLDLLLAGVGPVIPGAEIRLADPATGNAVGPGQTGEVCVRGPHVMAGYFRAAAQTSEAIDAEGWLHSGDLAIEVREGLYRITGRLKDMYIHGGLKVYPAEVENVLYLHPAVLHAAVVGLPDPRLGEVGHAFIQRRTGMPAEASAIMAFARERLADYKVPRGVTFVDEFPVTPNGKIQKFRLQRLARGA
ncbi:MAG: AMP-binding protein [Candidatus Methylomirabilota bacterium]